MADISLSQSAFVALKSATKEIGDRPVYSVDISLGEISESSEYGRRRTVDVKFTVGYAGTFEEPCAITYRCSLVSGWSSIFGWDLWLIEQV